MNSREHSDQASDPHPPLRGLEALRSKEISSILDRLETALEALGGRSSSRVERPATGQAQRTPRLAKQRYTWG